MHFSIIANYSAKNINNVNNLYIFIYIINSEINLRLKVKKFLIN